MRNRARVVTGYVPLKVKHMDPLQFYDLGQQLEHAVYGHAGFQCFEKFPYEKCWLAKENPPMVGANPRAEDRFETDEQHAKNNVVCGQFVEWAQMSLDEDPNVDVIVALTYSVLKQGDFTGKRVQPHHIGEFLERVAAYDFVDIPYPGMSDRVPVDVCGHNWRFAGSCHIWPVKWLRQINRCYKIKTLQTIRTFGKTPLDLAIWPMVEADSGLPFRQYKAEYDATQFTNFPGV
jgi:hypothetical protein